jgi:4-hydroxybenzoate polyprenyltransferase
VLIVLCAVFLLVGVVSACLIPEPVLHIGLLTALLVGVYFFMLHKLFFWAKEIFIASLYTLGIFIAPLSFCAGKLSTAQVMLMPEVFLLVLANLLVFSWFDGEKDKESGFPSLVNKLGQGLAQKIITCLLTLGVLFCVVVCVVFANKPTMLMQVILLMMYGFLAFIFKYDYWFRKNDSYRIIGDGIFFIPILILLLC